MDDDGCAGGMVLLVKARVLDRSASAWLAMTMSTAGAVAAAQLSIRGDL